MVSYCGIHRFSISPFHALMCGCWLAFACHGVVGADDVDEKPPVYGKIVDDLGKPVTEAEVALQGSRYYRTQSDEHGRYEFVDAMEPGEYRLSVKSKRWVGITDYRKLPRLLISPNEPVEKNVTLKRTCQIEVRVEDEQENAIRGVVLYCKWLGADRNRTSDRNTTNKNGVATIGGLAPSKTGYIIGSSSKAHAPSQVVIEADDPETVQQATIVLKKGETVRGKAICSDGEPAAGWRILCLPDWWRFGVYPSGATIAEDGSFELQHVGSGQHNVTISIPMGDGMSSTHSVLANADLTRMESPIEVKLDYPSPGSMNYLTGKIRWIGKPLNKSFEISGFSREGRHYISGRVKAGAKEFKIGPAPPGDYRIRAEHAELECMNLRKIKNLSDLDHVKLPNEKPVQIVLRVRGKPQLRGSVVDEETKKPIERFRYRVTKLRTLSGPNYVEDDHWVQVKNGDGRFEKDVNGPGIYQVSVLANGYAINTSESINTDDEPEKSVTVELGQGVSVRGTVVNADGKPIDGATVRALSLASGSMPRVASRFVNNEGAVETKNGEFVFSHLREGIDTFRVTHPDFVFSDAANVLVSAATEPLRIKLTKGATIQGHVFDDHGKPEPNVTLFFQDNYAYGGGDREAGQFGKATTDAGGKYIIERIPAQPCYVSRSEEWNSLGVVRHALLAVDGVTHELNLGGDSPLRGQLIINDRPAMNTRLQIGGKDSTFGAMKMFARTDGEGRFAFFGAPPGHWTLYREIDGRRSEWGEIRKIDVAPERVLDLGAIKHRVTRLTVTCETTAAALPERLQMQLQRYNHNTPFGRQAAIVMPRESPDDPFVIEGVSPGDYELVCDGAGDFQLRQRVVITDAEIDSSISFEIPVGTAILTAEMRNDVGDPLTNPFCMIWSDDGRINARFKAKANDEGKPLHETPKLPAGRYKVRGANLRHSNIIGEFVLVQNQDQSIELVIPNKEKTPKGRASLTITDASGIVVPCRIEFSGEGSQGIVQRPSAIKTTLSGPPGHYTVRIDQPGFEPHEQEIELSPNFGKNSELRVRLRRKRPNRD